MHTNSDTSIKTHFDAATRSVTIWPDIIEPTDLSNSWAMQHLLLSWGNGLAAHLAAALDGYDRRILISVRCAEAATAVRLEFKRVGIGAPSIDEVFDLVTSTISDAENG
jgi:hypothetical protein